MRYLFFALLAGLLLFSAPLSAHAQIEQSSNRTISVTGEGEVRVVPDQVLISMVAETRGPELLDTQKQNDVSVKAVVDYATKTLDVEEKHVQTDFVNVEPVYRNCNYNDELAGKCNPLDIIYYKVRKGIQVRLNDLTQYEELITKSLQSGVTHIDDVQFITTELRKHRDKAREMAAQAAQEKAQAVAETLGVTVKKPMTINTESYSMFNWSGSSRGGNPRMMMQNAVQESGGSGSEGEGGGLAIGQINVSATVRVTYEIE
ncbi:MAG: SIMPL domain-containing protein [Alphaproteobacteria bacterium]|nr:SIMPL domain-containing protein [Alphaproteobacteria bacterium]